MSSTEAVLWSRKPRAQTPPIASDLAVDVAIVGGGMAGLMCAHRAAELGLRVAVLEATFCGGGATGRSSGFITPASELELDDLVESHGEAGAKALWSFAQGGCDAIEALAVVFGEACDFRRQDSLYVATRPGAVAKVRANAEMRARFGLPGRLLDADGIRDAVDARGYLAGLRYGGTFAIDPLGFCQALKDVLLAAGVVVHEGSRALGVERHAVFTERWTVRAEHVVVCTDRFLPELGIASPHIHHAQTFLAASAPLRAEDLDALFPGGPLMVWDTELVYHYLRPTGDGRLLVGGADLVHTYGAGGTVPRSIRAGMTAFARRTFPWLQFEIDAIWPGLIGVTKDLLPIAGRHSRDPRVELIGGATGLPWAAALGRRTADRILHGPLPIDDSFSCERSGPMVSRVQQMLGKGITFALSHAAVKLGAR